jgi:hypothetical protein
MPQDTRDLILAYCGLVCSECGMFLKGRCQGCHSDKPMYRNCKVKRCAEARKYTTCADCADFQNLKECRKLYNLLSRLFGLVFRTNRIANLNRIREVGLEEFKGETIRLQGR